MDDEKPPPIVFANRVVKQFAENLVQDADLKPHDYTVIRVTFRKLGGSWFELCHGNVPHILLLTQVVRTWGKR